MAFAWRAFPARGGASPGAYLTVPALRSAGIRVAFTTRHGGFSDEPYSSLNLSFVSGDDATVVRANRARVLDDLGVPPSSWTSGKQVHGCGVAVVTDTERGAGHDAPDSTLADTDALITERPGTTLAVLTADCVPILLARPDPPGIGVVHAGWRGLVSGVIQAGVRALVRRGEGVRGYIGPAIGPCCYEIGPEVADRLRAGVGGAAVRTTAGAAHGDLWRAARETLRATGVTDVSIAALCTRCEPERFFSHRAGDAGRQGVIAALEPS